MRQSENRALNPEKDWTSSLRKNQNRILFFFSLSFFLSFLFDRSYKTGIVVRQGGGVAQIATLLHNKRMTACTYL